MKVKGKKVKSIQFVDPPKVKAMVPAHKPPLTPTTEKNGTAAKRYYAYVFHANNAIENPHMASMAVSLEGEYPNIGELWLKIGSKLIGVPTIKSFQVVWVSGTAHMTLRVIKEVDGSFELGTIEPTESYVQWHEGNPPKLSQTKYHGPPPVNPYNKPPPVAVLSTEVKWVQTERRAEDRAPNSIAPEKIYNGVEGKKGRIYGYHITAVIRWMGRDAWTFEDVRLLLHKLGIYMADATVTAQLCAGRKGERGERGDPAPLTQVQADALYKVLEGNKEVKKENFVHNNGDFAMLANAIMNKPKKKGLPECSICGNRRAPKCTSKSGKHSKIK